MSDDKRLDVIEKQLYHIEERYADLQQHVIVVERRCTMLEKHYAPIEHPDSARLKDLLERLDGAGITLLDRDRYSSPASVGWHYTPTPKNEPCFTLDAYLRLTDDPCSVCQRRGDYRKNHPCNACARCGWEHTDEMMDHFELHEALK